MNEKTTVYIEPDLKKSVQIQLIKNEDDKSLSALINKLLTNWMEDQKYNE